VSKTAVLHGVTDHGTTAQKTKTKNPEREIGRGVEKLEIGVPGPSTIAAGLAVPKELPVGETLFF